MTTLTKKQIQELLENVQKQRQAGEKVADEFTQTAKRFPPGKKQSE